MPVSTARARLRAAISEKVVPVLLSKGYQGPSELKGNALVHEYRRSTPQGTHVLEIQFEKYQRPRFAINLYVEPPGGMESLTRNGGTITTGRLKARPGATTRSWFRADRSWWEQMILRHSDTVENEAVELCLSLLPEVEAWWSSQRASPHITSWPVKYVAQQTAGI
jgi:hypothetical protein